MDIQPANFILVLNMINHELNAIGVTLSDWSNLISLLLSTLILASQTILISDKIEVLLVYISQVPRLRALKIWQSRGFDRLQRWIGFQSHLAVARFGLPAIGDGVGVDWWILAWNLLHFEAKLAFWLWLFRQRFLRVEEVPIGVAVLDHWFALGESLQVSLATVGRFIVSQVMKHYLLYAWSLILRFSLGLHLYLQVAGLALWTSLGLSKV